MPVNPSCSVSVQVALVFPNNDPAASMVAFYGCLLAEVVPVPIEVPLTRKVKSMLSPAGRVRLGHSGTFCGEVRMRRWLVFKWLYLSGRWTEKHRGVFVIGEALHVLVTCVIRGDGYWVRSSAAG